MSEQQETTQARRRVRQTGMVASVAGAKSVVVRVERRVKHDRYNKFISRSTKFMAHDEENQCGVGDLVEIVSSRPLSARKRWRIAKIVRKAVVAGAAKEG